jgi:hypothetical protein
MTQTYNPPFVATTISNRMAFQTRKAAKHTRVREIFPYSGVLGGNTKKIAEMASWCRDMIGPLMVDWRLTGAWTPCYSEDLDRNTIRYVHTIHFTNADNAVLFFLVWSETARATP